YMHSHILLPLGMEDAAWELSAATQPVAVGITMADGQRRRATEWKNGAMEACGGLYASLADMERFVTFELTGWPPRPGPDDPYAPLSRASLRESQSVLGPTVRPGAQVGGGWFTEWRAAQPGHLVGHAGALPGYRSWVVLAPRKDLGMILLATQPADDGWPVEDEFRNGLAPAAPEPSVALSENERAALGDLLSSLPTHPSSARERLFSESFNRDVSAEKLQHDVGSAL